MMKIIESRAEGRESVTSRHSTVRPLRQHSAFSLVELLIVVAIITVMASLMGPTLNSALRGTALTQATDKVIGVLSFAHQTALTKAQTVEVRFYSYVDPETPGDTGQGHAIQVFGVDDAGTATPLMKAQTLPQTVVMTTNSYNAQSASTLLGLTNSSSTNVFKIPRVGTNYSYSGFQFYRSGATSLANSSQTTNAWSVTLVNAADLLGAKGSTLPLNYTTVVVDPFNGSLKTYRPSL
jgi:uncharacterized protein (TIGR02596 family)